MIHKYGQYRLILIFQVRGKNIKSKIPKTYIYIYLYVNPKLQKQSIIHNLSMEIQSIPYQPFTILKNWSRDRRTKKISKIINRSEQAIQTKNLLINYYRIICSLIERCYRKKNQRHELGLQQQEYILIINILKKKSQQHKLSMFTFKEKILSNHKLCKYLIKTYRNGQFQTLILQSDNQIYGKLISLKYLNRLFNAFHSPDDFNQWKLHLTPEERQKRIIQRRLRRRNQKLQNPNLESYDDCGTVSNSIQIELEQTTHNSSSTQYPDNHQKLRQIDLPIITNRIPFSKQQQIFKERVEQNQSPQIESRIIEPDPHLVLEY